MMTQLAAALNSTITPAMEAAAKAEQVSPELVRSEVAAGRAVVPCNPAHSALVPAVAGRAFRTKVNANIGFSPDLSSREEEQCKLTEALSAGADFVMDLSVGKELGPIRQLILDTSTVAVGTVPIYEALSRLDGDGTALTDDLLLQVITEQAEQGVDFMTIHAGLLREHVPLAVRRAA